jgi:PAS domain S-box-containing protein
MLSGVLEAEGYAVTTAADGHEALDCLSRDDFGVAIVDKNLPGGISGLDVLRETATYSQHLRTIIFTGYPSKESAIEALKHGAFDYLEKPIDNELLVEQVRRAWDAYTLALEREELFRKYEMLFEIVPGIVWFMTEDGIVKRVNREGAAMLGYSPTELLGSSYTRLLPPDEGRSASHWAFKERRTGNRATRKQVIELRTRSGATKLFEINSIGAWDRTVMDKGKRFWGTLGVGWDITEHAALEEQLQQARKMEAIGRLAGGVAHDFNNLLSVILNNAEFLRGDLADKDPRLPDVIEIERAAHRGAELTKQLLAFSRKQVVSPRPTNLRHVLKDLEPLLRRLITENIQLETPDGDDDLWLVEIDPSQVEQVIINLAVNARDAMPDGGRLTIRATNVVLDHEFAANHLGVSPGHYVMLAVSDTGHGMTPEVREHLFEPFYTTKGIGRGTGLGMATVYGIVMQSGGHISVYSEAETGTSVKVYLLAIDASVSDDELYPETEELVTGQEVVLVVEDEDMVRRLARRILERHGYRVLEASDGAAALAGLDVDTPVDILLTDVVMPNMSGAELAQKLRSRMPKLRVIYMSGYVGNVTTRHQMLEHGTAYLQKPFTAVGLLQSIRRLLDEPMLLPTVS